MKAYYYNHSISVTTTNYKLPSLFLLSEVLILSGLQIGGSNTKQLALSLLSEYVSGGLGSAEEASKICRVIIAGDSITHEAHDKEQHSKVEKQTTHVRDTSQQPLFELTISYRS